jgi:hypothetical protein
MAMGSINIFTHDFNQYSHKTQDRRHSADASRIRIIEGRIEEAIRTL